MAAAAIFNGCHSIGPHLVATARFDYSSSIADSWKQQTLLNIFKLRYLDLPVFVDVSLVVASYSLQSGIGMGTLFDGPPSASRRNEPQPADQIPLDQLSGGTRQFLP